LRPSTRRAIAARTTCNRAEQAPADRQRSIE
jgi:hypothetical protein